MNTEYGPRNPERDIDRQWESEDIIETKDMNRIENLVRMLTNHTIWDDELGDTILRDSEPPRKINVKEMSSTAGGITPTPPSEELDKSILFADGYHLLNVTQTVGNDNTTFTINRSNDAINVNPLTSFNIGAASTEASGLMSATDKSHLNTIWDGKLLNNATIVTSGNINSITGLVTTSNFTDQLLNIGVASTTANGLAPQLVNDNTKFLNGTGGWSVPTGTYSHPTDGASTSTPVGPTGNVSPGFGGTFSVPYININNLGHTTSAVSRTITIPSTIATTNNSGLMSASLATALNDATSNINTLFSRYSHYIGGGSIYLLWSSSTFSKITSSANLIQCNFNNTQFSNASNISSYRFLILEMRLSWDGSIPNDGYFIVPCMLNGDANSPGYLFPNYYLCALRSWYRWVAISDTYLVALYNASGDGAMLPSFIWGVR